MFGILDGIKLGAGILAGLALYHLYAVTVGYPSAVREARAGYVLVAEKTAAEARAEEMERQRNAAAQATEEHRKRLQAAQASEQAAKDTLEKEIAEHEKALDAAGAVCRLTDADLRWLRNQR
jgi:molecular chaperone DnaK (HSP70)